MRVVQEREHQRDRDRLQAGLADGGRDTGDLVLRQVCHHRALGVDPFGDLEAPAARHKNRWSILEQIVQVDARGTPQFQQIAEAARGDEAGAGAFVLQQRVGDDGGGVRQQRNVGWVDIVLL